jgi:hypothetical protein
LVLQRASNDEDSVSETMRLQCVGVARTVVRKKCEGDDGSSRGKEGFYLITQRVLRKEQESCCTDVVFRICPVSASVLEERGARFRNVSRCG